MKFEKCVKIPGGLFGADHAIHVRPNADKDRHDRRMDPHGSVAETADFCLRSCPHPDEDCSGNCAALKKELKRLQAEKKGVQENG